ncbi:hypothetical protein TcWFU_000366 [Taenia crassiceps]|uniref:Uncharacterized protein n=1 Tax=Taenia crassiceps TaxID=6207 RepID=A0ABR4PZU5_9CEST
MLLEKSTYADNNVGFPSSSEDPARLVWLLGYLPNCSNCGPWRRHYRKTMTPNCGTDGLGEGYGWVGAFAFGG